MRARTPYAILLTLGLLVSGCVTGPKSPRASDQHPFAGSSYHDSVILLSHRDPGTGTAVRIGPKHLLTAMHVIDGYLEDGDTFDLRFGATMGPARLVAHGDKSVSHGDWALLEVVPDLLGDLPATPVHPDALNEAWKPPLGTELIFAGYATCFVEGNSFDPAMPAPILVREVVPPLDSTNPDFAWYAAHDGVDKLSGMSGGPVMIWDPEQRRPELIGLFVGVSKASSTLETPLFDMSL
ncbi:MAG: hypothetical protein P1V35_04515, partial [Planctomycetota bacterium]|nr:hypothetical protein [Planctomycetota bacterium]